MGAIIHIKASCGKEVTGGVSMGERRKAGTIKAPAGLYNGLVVRYRPARNNFLIDLTSALDSN